MLTRLQAFDIPADKDKESNKEMTVFKDLSFVFKGLNLRSILVGFELH